MGIKIPQSVKIGEIAIEGGKIMVATLIDI